MVGGERWGGLGCRGAGFVGGLVWLGTSSFCGGGEIYQD